MFPGFGITREAERRKSIAHPGDSASKSSQAEHSIATLGATKERRSEVEVRPHDMVCLTKTTTSRFVKRCDYDYVALTDSLFLSS